jgi:predicted small lipoprotein YifL
MAIFLAVVMVTSVAILMLLGAPALSAQPADTTAPIDQLSQSSVDLSDDTATAALTSAVVYFLRSRGRYNDAQRVLRGGMSVARAIPGIPGWALRGGVHA